MLVEGCASEGSFDLRSYDYQSNLSSAVGRVGLLSFVENNEEQSIVLELRIGTTAEMTPLATDNARAA
jgi:hypothetical protein